VSADRDKEPEAFHGKAANDKCDTLRRVSKEDQRGENEKESGGHHKQSGIFHALSSF
jgi:hypothetical protein